MISAGGALFALATPQTAVAATCDTTFLGIPQWCRGMDTDKLPPINDIIWKIVLNVLEMGLWAAGYISAAFILYGGISYILTQGVVEGAIKARTMILNAIIGLVISMISASVVGFVVTKVLPGGDPTKLTDAKTVWEGLLSIVYMVSGAFAVIIIILAGFSYTTANGDPSKIAKAKNAIMYAVIGLVVVLIAFLVTQFVIGKMST
jgi:hypothetical protein